ncbi:MAG TPA: hypothetical protein DCZ69_15710 [Syntrophobacteraceae bacterium]|nr:hypothetical protein [Syntrophobacteraceae bacterium]
MLRRLLLSSLPKSQWGAIAVVATAASLAIGWHWTQLRPSVRVGVPPSVVVEIVGDVPHPGIFALESPVTVLQALGAAGVRFPGSALPRAAPISYDEQLSTGRRLRVVDTAQDNRHIIIEPMSAAARLTLGLRLDLNKASPEDLALVPGMKPCWVEAIAARRGRQPWRHLDELQEIPGIGPRTVAKWSGFVEATQGDDLP